MNWSGSTRSPWIEIRNATETEALIYVGLHTEPVD